MRELERAVKNGIRILEKEVERKVADAIKNDSLVLWKGYKIIPVAKWESMKMTYSDQHRMLGYVPEDFVENPFFYFPRDDKELPEKRKEWYESYYEYLDERKMPGFGKKLCGGCILNPGLSLKNMSIRDAVVKTSIVFEHNEKFPCDIINFFKCPYKPEESGSFLTDLGYMCKIVDDALFFAHSLSYCDNQKMFEANFELDIVEEYFSLLSTTPSSIDRAERTISGLKLSKVSILWIEDIYNAITNRKTLDILLEQYIDSIANDYYYSKKKNAESEKRAEEIRKFKDYIINVFMDIKDKIKLKDLQGIHGVTLEEEANEKQRLDGVKKWILQNHPDKADFLCKPRHGKCTTCDGFANIHCINCDIWVCDEHWRQHKNFHDNKNVNKNRSKIRP